jgi:GalNAc5-diNAcBac-PP-undecaprenol beta-1,3-glucosyltransferase
MIKPNVSIIIATYNRAHLILESLNSVVNQTYDNWECLIIDDGSSDDTETVVNKLLKNDSRFRYLKRPKHHKKGLPGCRNYGLSQAEGNYIIFFDDDDIAHPLNLELCVSELEKSNTSFCRYLRTTFTGNFHEKWNKSKDYDVSSFRMGNLEEMITGKIPFNSCQIMWTKDCFDEERFNESLMYAEEWELYQRVLSKGKKGINISKVLYFGRKHPNSNTGEFWKGDKKRRESNEKAIKLVIDNLQNKDLLSRYLIRYFVQMSVFLKNKTILEYVLAKSNMTIVEKIKYRFFYEYYPVLVLGHRTKKLLKKIIS